MSSTLRSVEIGDAMNAPKCFGTDPGLVVARPSRGLMPWLTVPEGYYALVTINGAEQQYTGDGTPTPVWPSGFHFAKPVLTKISHLVTKQYIIFDAPVKGCKTKDNVTVEIDVSTTFRIMGDARRGERPELLQKFVHQVTPAGLESQLKDALAEEIRRLARSMKHTEVYACRTGLAAPVAEIGQPEGKASEKKQRRPSAGVTSAVALGEDDEIAMFGVDVTLAMKANLNRQFEPQGVSISDVMIQNVVLPEQIMQQMSNKSMVRSKQDYEMMEQQFEMQSIQMKNEKAALKLSHREDQEKAVVQGSLHTQALKDTFLERKAQRERILGEYKEHTHVEMSKLGAGTSETLVKLQFDKERVLQTFALEAKDAATALVAEADYKIVNLEAETKLTVARDEADAQTTMSNAEFKADSNLAKMREIEERTKRLTVYEALAKNEKLVLSSSSDKEQTMMLFADNVLSSSPGEEGSAACYQQHGTMLAELNMLRLASASYGLLRQNEVYIPENNKTGALPGL